MLTHAQVMAKLGVKEGVTVLKKFDEGSVEYTGAISDIEKVKEFVNTQRRQVIYMYTLQPCMYMCVCVHRCYF